MMKYVALFLVAVFAGMTAETADPPKPRGHPTHKIDLINKDNLEYYGIISIGEPPVEFKVIFDTSMDWTWMPGPNCIYQCHNQPHYNPEESRTAVDKHKSASFFYTNGEKSGNLVGDIFVDNYAFSDSAVAAINFLVVHTEADLFEDVHASGFIGLTSTNHESDLNFVQALRMLKLIDYDVFAMRFTDTKEGSSIVFGDYDRSLVSSNDIMWNDNMGIGRWRVRVQKIMYGEDAITLHTDWLQITTAETHMRMHRSDFRDIQRKLEEHLSCMFRAADYLFICYVPDKSLSRFRDIEIHLPNGIIYVEPHEYVQFETEKKTNKLMAILQIEVISDDREEGSSIGLFTLRHYYTIYDMETSKIGIVALKAAPFRGSSSGVALGILLPTLFLLVALAVYFVYRKRAYGYCFSNSSAMPSISSALLSTTTL